MAKRYLILVPDSVLTRHTTAQLVEVNEYRDDRCVVRASGLVEDIQKLADMLNAQNEGTHV